MKNYPWACVKNPKRDADRERARERKERERGREKERGRKRGRGRESKNIHEEQFENKNCCRIIN